MVIYMVHDDGTNVGNSFVFPTKSLDFVIPLRRPVAGIGQRGD